MSKDLKSGDKIIWSSHGGEAHGHVVKKVTSETCIKSHRVAAATDDPQFIGETVEGKLAAHKPEAFKKG